MFFTIGLVSKWNSSQPKVYHKPYLNPIFISARFHPIEPLILNIFDLPRDSHQIVLFLSGRLNLLFGSIDSVDHHFF